MAFLVKNISKGRSVASNSADQGVLAQWIQVTRPAAATNVNATPEMCFRVFGGRVLVLRLVMEVTTAIGAAATTHKWSSKALSAAGVAIGTAVDLTAASASLTGREVGATLTALGSGGAGIINNAGAAITTLGTIPFVLPQGEVYSTTAGADTTGAVKYDIWYQPLDAGAYIVPVAALTAVI